MYRIIGNEKATVYFQLIALKYRISNNYLQDTKSFWNWQIKQCVENKTDGFTSLWFKFKSKKKGPNVKHRSREFISFPEPSILCHVNFVRYKLNRYFFVYWKIIIWAVYETIYLCLRLFSMLVFMFREQIHSRRTRTHAGNN